VASSASDTAQKVFGGTSGATPYAAAVTVMLRNFYYDNLTNEVLPSPGLLFASLIAFGNEAPNSTTGSGKTKMGKKALSCSKWDWGSEFVAEGSSKVFNLTVGSGEKDLKAGIWWPDYGSHNDFNLTIVKGTTPIGSSTNTTSVFERVQKLGSLATGTYTVTIQAVRTQGTTAREVFWLVHRTKC
jgi:serine protease AprX